MAHVVTSRCIDCRYTECCSVCPVDCFYELHDPKMLVIDPDTCIDCRECVPKCPVHAIYEADELPDPYREWIEKNADLWESGENITETKEALPEAKTLDEVQRNEKDQSWDIAEPRYA
ncbi:MAG: ferredoxin family protein [Planctomycetes bacterium]|nr:ferredoxin family protein [Planctomycetota bacterium]